MPGSFKKNREVIIGVGSKVNQAGTAMALEDRIKQQAHRLGFELVGIAPATEADGFGRLCEWLDDGHAGEMAYMQRHADARRHPSSILANVRSVDALASLSRRIDPLALQRPFAIILGCADSRAPAETIFDQGLGDLFVIRVAGNIVAPSQVGSVEFAAEHFGTQLVVVMGHSHCGAIAATVAGMQPTHDGPPRSRNLLSITDRIAPENVHRLIAQLKFCGGLS